MTSATDELRLLLDERGVEHEDKHTELVPDIDGWDTTWWQGVAGMTFMAISDETVGRENCVYINGTYLTPEQAIAATLGGERERELELLVKQLWYLVNHRSGYGYAAALESIEELGIEGEQ